MQQRLFNRARESVTFTTIWSFLKGLMKWSLNEELFFHPKIYGIACLGIRLLSL